MTSPLTYVELSEDVAFREFGGEAVLLNLESGIYFGLNEVGTRLWVLLSERRSLGEAVEIILGEYDVDPQRLEADVMRLLREMEEKGLLRVTAGARSVA